jgi:DNA replication protein DnaC
MIESKIIRAGDLSRPVIHKLSEKSFDCPRHGPYRGIPHGYYWGGMKEPSIINPECPECAKEREIIEVEYMARKERESAIARFRAMNIGEKFWYSTFENFDAYNDELKHHLEAAKKFAEKPEGKLIMIGENGNGKNHLAAVILKKTGGLIYTCYEIGFMLRDCYNGINSEGEFFNRLCRDAPLLIIDELDKIKESEAKNNWMSYVIGKRHDNMLPVIFIANGHLQEDCKESKKPCPKCIEYHLENDVISRVFEDGILLKFTSPDYRYKIGSERVKK